MKYVIYFISLSLSLSLSSQRPGRTRRAAALRPRPGHTAHRRLQQRPAQSGRLLAGQQRRPANQRARHARLLECAARFEFK